MMKIILIIILFAANTYSAYAEDVAYVKWLSRELELLPNDIKISFPRLNSFVDEIDQKELSLRSDPNRRNEYINERYAVIAKELNRCLKTDKANWFHFAAWASKSAGEVISGQKFENLKGAERYLFSHFGNWKKIYNEKKQIEIFASTNALIAIEMIPVGDLFLDLFCQEKNNSFEVFKQYFMPSSSSERFLFNAFKSYYQVIQTQNNIEKDELLLLASLYQLNAEQMRIDHLLEKVFWIKARSRLVRTFFRRVATKKGKLKIGNDQIIDLTKKLDFIKPGKRERKVNLQPLVQFFNTYQVPKVTKKNKLKVGTSNWSNIKSRMRFLSGFFWSYMISENILMPAENNTKYLESTRSLKRQWSDQHQEPSDDNLIEIYEKINAAWKNSINSVGDRESMKLRADKFKNLFFDNPNFYFGLSTAHLTLGIDRFASMGESLKRKFSIFKDFKILNELIVWGNELKSINQKMTQLVLFSKDIYEMSKREGLQKIIDASSSNRALFRDLVEVMSLLKLWRIVETENDPEVLMNVAGEFIEWEHQQIIRPRMEKSLLLVSERFERILKNIPGKMVEKTILKPFKVKTTINLQCFKKPKHIRTKNFLDTQERILRAKEFLQELQKIDFDPSMNCFNDPYYEY